MHFVQLKNFYQSCNNSFMQIKVASLNFSGINISPFEYHDGSLQKTHLNSLFQAKLDSQHKSRFAEPSNLAKIDKGFQRDRYTLLYRTDVGVVRGRLLDKEQFEAVWDLAYDSFHPTIEFSSKANDTNKTDEIDNLKLFDRLLYEIFLESVFGEIDWQQIKNYCPELYLKALKAWHSKPYLQLETKVKMVHQYLIEKDLDFLFLQEAEVDAIAKDLPIDYTYVFEEQSMIILKKSYSFEDQKTDQFKTKYNQLLKFNNDSVYWIGKSFLLISSHLSSKKIKFQQAQNMKQVLNQIMTEYPQLKLIIGIDANQFLTSMDLLNLFPLSEHNFTTRKRRTDMQLQFNKSGIIAQDVRDHLITNLQFIESKVETIKGESIGNELLPNQKHPFDHFIIYSTIKYEEVKPKRKNTVTINIPGLPIKNPLKKTNTMSTEVASNAQSVEGKSKPKTTKYVPPFCFSNRESNDKKKALLFNKSIDSGKKSKKIIGSELGMLDLKGGKKLSFVQDSPLEYSVLRYSNNYYKQGIKTSRSPSKSRKQSFLNNSKDSLQFGRKSSIKVQKVSNS